MGMHMGRPGGPRIALNKAKGARSSAKTLRRIWELLKRDRARLILVLALTVLSTLLNLLIPILIGSGVDIIERGISSSNGIDFAALARTVVTMLGIAVFVMLAFWFQTRTIVKVAQSAVMRLRKDAFDKLHTLSLRFFDSHTHGELMSRLANDVENVGNALSQSVTQIFSSTITVLGSLAFMIYLNPWLALLTLISVPLGLLVTSTIAKRTRKHYTAQQKHLGELNGFAEEAITGMKAVKAFTREKQMAEQFDNINTNLRTAAVNAQFYSGTIPPIMNIISNLSFAVTALAGGSMVISGAITVGVIASFLNYSRQFSRPINEIANQFNMIQAAIAGAERIFDIMDKKSDMPDKPDAINIENVRGDVVFENVTFGYKEGEHVLKNVSLHAKPGDAIALVGPTGAGKTTIVNLLTRFYDVNSGRILIDGHDIRDLNADSLRRCQGMVLQDTVLFADTVRENIRYGRLDATDEEVIEAAKMSNAHQFIKRLPEGYDTVLAEDGKSLSQGQRQLLSISRAVLANPSILILDEATSSVDTRTEMNIQQAMLKLMQGRTSFVIAHRLSTIRGAKEILVIKDGEIIERGSHEQLIRQEGFYYNLYNTQLKRQEEAV
ncbi:MAG: ABC transporter ATP-binding protein [Christensenellales bacterium]|jgi:ATP-binding cassette subfamily B multidrug efflux pump